MKLRITWTRKFQDGKRELDNLDEMLLFKRGWDSYDADPPNKLSVDNTRNLLNNFEKVGLFPNYYPSREGGVMIYFNNDCFIDVDNAGDIVFIIVDDVWFLNELGMEESVSKVRVFLEKGLR